MKIGTFLLQVERLQLLYRLPSLEEALKLSAMRGISCVDGDTNLYNRLDLSETKKILDDQGVQTSSVYHVAGCEEILGSGRQKLQDDLKYQLDRCAFMETKLLMPVPQCSTQYAFQDRQKLMMEYLAAAAELAEPYGIQTVLENYSRAESACTTNADVDYFLSQLPQVGYVLDTGNFWFTYSEVMEALEKHLDRIVHVHVKDIKGISVDPPRVLEGRGFDVVAIGEGDLPLKEIVERLKKNNYTGALSIEISSQLRLAEKMEASVCNLQTWIK